MSPQCALIEGNPCRPHRRRILLTGSLTPLLAKRRGDRKAQAVIWLQQNKQRCHNSHCANEVTCIPLDPQEIRSIAPTLPVRKLKLHKQNDLPKARQPATGSVRAEPGCGGHQSPSPLGAVAPSLRPGCLDKAGAPRAGSGQLRTGMPRGGVMGISPRWFLCSAGLP